MSGNKPVDTLRDGNIKSTIWRNKGEKGDFYSVEISRTYKDDRGDYHDTKSFGSNDMLRVSELSRRSHHRVNEIRRAERSEQAREPTRDRR